VALGLRWPKVVDVGPGFVLKTPPPDGVFDGHSIVLVGYADDARQPGGGTFLFRNSFGKAWADGGHARLTYRYVAAYGNDALTLDVK
jgi:C1A family cysteine protease